VNTFTDPIARGEALIALGKVNATDYLPRVIQLLMNISLIPGKGKRSQEIVAYGAVVSLEEYGDPSGYVPVYFVSVGWFSDRLKSKAKEVLPKLSGNPTEPLISILQNSGYDYSVKYEALRALQAADTSAQDKSQGAVVALTESTRAGYNSLEQSSILAGIRKLAMDMIRAYGSDDDTVYPLLDNCYKRGINLEERITAVAALSALATDEAVQRLSNYLYDLNDKLYWNVMTKTDERLVRAVIPALGNTGQPKAKEALRTVLQCDWVYDIHRLAEEAIKKIPEAYNKDTLRGINYQSANILRISSGSRAFRISALFSELLNSKLISARN
jgi:HEAT repeat protein